jgi:ABC-type antimicrobial peptide transport system permease subunit
VRFGRHALTGAGIALGTAFFASVLTLRAAESLEGPLDPASSSRLAWLAATSLLMCLAGITNSMLMSVTERFREIGTIKCIGASDGFVVKVFFLEAALLGVIGSVAGSVVGTLLMSGAVTFLGYPFPGAALPSILGAGCGVGVAMTVLAAILPAIQAARMPAASALRMEV